MCQKAELQGRHTNHSGRHTTVQTLSKKGFGDNDIQKLTGHKNIQSLQSYKQPDIHQQRVMSHAISSTLAAAPSTPLAPCESPASHSVPATVTTLPELYSSKPPTSAVDCTVLDSDDFPPISPKPTLDADWNIDINDSLLLSAVSDIGNVQSVQRSQIQPECPTPGAPSFLTSSTFTGTVNININYK